MAKKSVIAGEYILSVLDSGSIEVYRIYDNVKGALREIAEKENALIIGRCADYILRNNKKRLSVFIYADINERKKRVAEKNPTLSQGEILDLINKSDKKRASYYNFYTGGKWGKYDNYHLALDSGKLGIEGCAKIIADAVKALF